MTTKPVEDVIEALEFTPDIECDADDRCHVLFGTGSASWTVVKENCCPTSEPDTRSLCTGCKQVLLEQPFIQCPYCLKSWEPGSEHILRIDPL